jgi:hypothetical protein
MASYLLWPLAVLGAVFWVMLPTGVLVMAVFYRGGQDHPDPDALPPSDGYDATEPAGTPAASRPAPAASPPGRPLSMSETRQHP